MENECIFLLCSLFFYICDDGLPIHFRLLSNLSWRNLFNDHITLLVLNVKGCFFQYMLATFFYVICTSYQLMNNFSWSSWPGPKLTRLWFRLSRASPMEYSIFETFHTKKYSIKLRYLCLDDCSRSTSWKAYILWEGSTTWICSLFYYNVCNFLKMIVRL